MLCVPKNPFSRSRLAGLQFLTPQNTKSWTTMRSAYYFFEFIDNKFMHSPLYWLRSRFLKVPPLYHGAFVLNKTCDFSTIFTNGARIRSMHSFSARSVFLKNSMFSLFFVCTERFRLSSRSSWAWHISFLLVLHTTNFPCFFLGCDKVNL